MRRRGQSWSVDAVLAVVIFGFIAIAVSSFSLLQQPDTDKLQANSQRVAVEVSAPVGLCDPAIVNESLDRTALNCIYQEDYDTFKTQHNLKGDFCIYVEDEQGQIIPFNGQNGWGSDELLLAGTPCGQ